MPRLFSHVDLRVRDLERSAQFYDAVLAVLGFRRQTYPRFAENEAGWRAPGWAPNDEFFGIVVDQTVQPNANRIAFSCTDRQQVANIAEAARRSGGRDIDGPQEYDGYNAVFFEDPDGHLLEACFITKHGGLEGESSDVNHV